jgi:hypothetical protein
MLTEQHTPESGDIVLTKTAYWGNKMRYETLYEKHGIILARVLGMRKDSPAKRIN